MGRNHDPSATQGPARNVREVTCTAALLMNCCLSAVDYLIKALS